MAIFFFLVLGLFFLASGYIAARICRALKRYSHRARVWVWVIVLLLDVSFFLIRVVNIDVVWLNRVIYVISTMWMIVMLYGVMIIGLLDIVRNILKFSGYKDPYHTPFILQVASVCIVLLMAYGYFNAITPNETSYEVSSDKLPSGENIRIALVSDIHMGYAVTTRDVNRLVEVLNDIHPDLTLIAGDLVDGDLLPVLEEDQANSLSRIVSPMGVYAVMGNHEYMDEADEAERYLSHIEGLHFLRDTQTVAGPFNIIGRDDKSNLQRRDISSFSMDTALINIVIDHQPADIDKASKAGADLYLSGHTHAGQVWPMRLFTSMIFKLDYGFACIGKTCAIGTSGYGTWGPRLRIGSDSEVVIINVKGTK